MLSCFICFTNFFFLFASVIFVCLLHIILFLEDTRQCVALPGTSCIRVPFQFRILSCIDFGSPEPPIGGQTIDQGAARAWLSVQLVQRIWVIFPRNDCNGKCTTNQGPQAVFDGSGVSLCIPIQLGGARDGPKPRTFEPIVAIRWVCFGNIWGASGKTSNDFLLVFKVCSKRHKQLNSCESFKLLPQNFPRSRSRW